MYGIITRAPSDKDATLQINAQQTLYDKVTWLRVPGLNCKPIIGQPALLLAYQTADNRRQQGKYLALPLQVQQTAEQAAALPENDTQIISASGASISLTAEGDIVLQPATGKKIIAKTDTIMATTDMGEQPVIIANDQVNVAGSPPVTGAITLTTPKT